MRLSSAWTDFTCKASTHTSSPRFGLLSDNLLEDTGGEGLGDELEGGVGEWERPPAPAMEEVFLIGNLRLALRLILDRGLNRESTYRKKY